MATKSNPVPARYPEPALSGRDKGGGALSPVFQGPCSSEPYNPESSRCLSFPRQVIGQKSSYSGVFFLFIVQIACYHVMYVLRATLLLRQVKVEVKEGNDLL